MKKVNKLIIFVLILVIVPIVGNMVYADNSEEWIYPHEALELGLIPKEVYHDGILLNIEELSKLEFTKVRADNTFDYGGMLWNLGVVSGVDSASRMDERLRTNSPLKREEMITVLVRMLNSGNNNYTPPIKPSFKDVPIDHWSYPYIEQAKELGLTDGIGNNLFGLGENLTYKETLILISKVLDKPISWKNAIYEAENNLQLISKEGKEAEVFLRKHAFELIGKSLWMKTSTGEDLYDLALKERASSKEYYKCIFEIKSYIDYMNQHKIYVGVGEDIRLSNDFMKKAREVLEKYKNSSYYKIKTVEEIEGLEELFKLIPREYLNGKIEKYIDGNMILIGQDYSINSRQAYFQLDTWGHNPKTDKYSSETKVFRVSNYSYPIVRSFMASALELIYDKNTKDEILYAFENGQDDDLNKEFETSTVYKYMFKRSEYASGIEIFIYK